MKDMPKGYEEKMMTAVSKNPELFLRIAKESEELMRSGRGQFEAVMEAAKKYEKELREIF